MIALAAAAALAYETDQLTDRERPLADALVPANLHMDELLSVAAREANRSVGCDAEPESLRRELALQIARAAGRSEAVEHRGLARQFGFGRYGAWIEESPDIDRREFDDRDDIYGGATIEDSVILRFAGPCSTLLLAGVLIGTDKLDHFLDTGYHYTQRPDEATAIRFGTRTERTYYGLWTSKAFSYGDLAANAAGYRFYEGLLGPDSAMQRDAQGCVVQARPFDWSAYVTNDWDEALNPSVYTRRIDRSLQAHIAADPERYCAAWRALGGPAYEEHLATVFASTPPYVRGRAPERSDPFGLAAFCGTR